MLRARIIAFLAMMLVMSFHVAALADPAGFTEIAGFADRAPDAASSSISGRPLTLTSNDSARVTRRITPKGETAAGDGSKTRGLPSVGSVLSAMALVMLAIFAAARLWKLHGPKVSTGMPGEAAEVLGRCRIEARQSIYLVRLGSRVLVLGSAGGELTMLTEVTDAAEVDLLCAQCRSGGETASPFSRLFAARQAAGDSTPMVADTPPGPFGVRAGLGSAERRLAERFRSHVSEQEPGRVA
jgi:flagellar biogenesis protein FliO